MTRLVPTASECVAPVLRHAAALGLVAICCLARWLADPLLQGNLAVLPATVSTIVAARWLGVGPGIVAVVVGLVAGDLLFERPPAPWAEKLARDSGVLLLSGLVGLLVVWTVTRLRNQTDSLRREIATRQRAEAEVEAGRRRLDKFLDAAPLCAYMKDADGRFVLVNRHLRETYPAVVVGSTVHDAFEATQADNFAHDDDWVRRTGESISCEEVATGPDGLVRHWSTYKFPMLDDDGRRGIGGMSIEVTDRKRADERVTITEQLLRRLIEVQEREKQSLCHEFHDGLMQYAFAARMMLEGWRQTRPDVEAALVDEAIRCIDAGIGDGRRALRGIRPAVLDDLGLRAAIEDVVNGLAAAGLEVEQAIDAGIDRVSPEIQTTAFRILQEATSNARKHSGSKRLRIAVRIEKDDLVVEVEDFGRGFDTASPSRSGFGIMGMTERTRLTGGSCSIESVPGKGTTVTARLKTATFPADG